MKTTRNKSNTCCSNQNSKIEINSNNFKPILLLNIMFVRLKCSNSYLGLVSSTLNYQSSNVVLQIEIVNLQKLDLAEIGCA